MALPSSSIIDAKKAADEARESTFPHLERQESEYSAAYSAASLLYARALLVEADSSDAAAATTAATAALRALDLAMLRGGVDEWARLAEPLINAATELLQTDVAAASSSSAADDASPSIAEWETRCHHFAAGAAHAGGRSIPRVDARTLTVDEFRSRFMEPSASPRPVILTHAIGEWPALGGGSSSSASAAASAWTMSSLRSRHGARLVPVETYSAEDATSTYLSDSWAQRVMPLSDYLDRYVLETPATDSSKQQQGDEEEDAATAKGYLAQHQLLDQIPSMRREIITPSFCSAKTSADRDAPSSCEVREAPIVSAWLGPGGTVSPLHTDPFHNLLCQVIGHKYIRLYAAKETRRLYPRSGALCNNCFVNLDQPDHANQPLFEDTPFEQCVLGPSEVLYIPRHVWHYVRSLEPSVSVSFWWGARMALTMTKEGEVEATY